MSPFLPGIRRLPMKLFFSGASLALATLAGCQNPPVAPAPPPNVVQVSIDKFNSSQGTIELVIQNTKNVDVCFPTPTLPDEERVSFTLWVYSAAGDDIPRINQGTPVFGAPDTVVGANQRRAVVVPLAANLERTIPDHACLVFRAPYAPCGSFDEPMSVSVFGPGLPHERVQILQGAWSIEDGAVTPSASCERFLTEHLDFWAGYPRR